MPATVFQGSRTPAAGGAYFCLPSMRFILVPQVGHAPCAARRRVAKGGDQARMRDPRPVSGKTWTRSSAKGLLMADYEGYCVKCREKRHFDGTEVDLANGRRAAQGTCPTCGTKMNRMLGK